MVTFVINKNGQRLMPTHNIKKVRHMLKDGRARIVGHKPFTIQLSYDAGTGVQPIEITEDAGYLHIGVSVKSEKHEYTSEQRDLLENEKKRHSKRLEYRRTRRNRLRYRKPRFDNRKASKPKGWIAPSLKNKVDQHIKITKRYAAVCPVAGIWVEVGQFDTQALTAMEEGKPLPKGTDYQQGPTFGYDNLREAVFARDGYKCQCCGKSGIKDGKILRMHHLGYLKGDRSNRMSNLITVCTDCHTPAAHQKGGALYGWKPKLKTFRGAAFMNTVKWYIYDSLKESFPDMVHLTYGSVTKRERNRRNIEKSHANDAYCIGKFRPKHRCPTAYYKKVRRHNRILTKFFDSQWIDRRDGSVKKGKQLPNGRVSRSHKKDTENLRIYRKKRVSKGYYSLRTKRYPLQPGDTVVYKNQVYTVDGAKNHGEAVKICNAVKTCNPSVAYVKRIHRSDGWAVNYKPQIV